MTILRTPELGELSACNRARRDRWHKGAAEEWTGADWSNAMCGEAGEAANIVKKLRRHETQIISIYNTPKKEELIAALADEIADVVIYADLLAHHYGINFAEAIIDKFNRSSFAQGFPEMLEPPRVRRYDE